MNYNQSQSCIEKIVGYWGTWNWSEQLKGLWRSQLSKFDYQTALKAIDETYMRKIEFQREIMPTFLSVIKAGVGVGGGDKEPVLLFSLVLEDATDCIFKRVGMKIPFSGTFLPDSDLIMVEAQKVKQKHEQMYGGAWGVIREFETVLVNDNQSLDIPF